MIYKQYARTYAVYIILAEATVWFPGGYPLAEVQAPRTLAEKLASESRGAAHTPRAHCAYSWEDNHRCNSHMDTMGILFSN